MVSSSPRFWSSHSVTARRKFLLNFKIGFDGPPFIPSFNTHLSHTFDSFLDNLYLSSMNLGFEIKASNMHIAVYVHWISHTLFPFNTWGRTKQRVKLNTWQASNGYKLGRNLFSDERYISWNKNFHVLLHPPVWSQPCCVSCFLGFLLLLYCLASIKSTVKQFFVPNFVFSMRDMGTNAHTVRIPLLPSVFQSLFKISCRFSTCHFCYRCPS